MAVNLSYSFFPLLPEASINENTRPGALIMEFFQVVATINTNAADVEVPTALGEVLGIIPLSYSSVFDTGDGVLSYTTDGVITTGAVTLRVSSASIANGACTLRGFLVGKPAVTTLLNS